MNDLYDGIDFVLLLQGIHGHFNGEFFSQSHTSPNPLVSLLVSDIKVTFHVETSYT